MTNHAPPFTFATFAAVLLSSMAIDGCSSSLRASEDIPVGVDLSGQWKLVSPAPEASKRLLEDAVAVMHEKRQRRMRRPGREGGAERDGPFGDLQMSAPFPSPQATSKQLEELALPPASFELRQTPEAVEFVFPSNREPRRLRPGATNAIGFLEYDTANVTCGWSGHAFLVLTKSPELATIEERYELTNKGQQLHATIKLEGQLVKSMEIQAVYERIVDSR